MKRPPLPNPKTPNPRTPNPKTPHLTPRTMELFPTNRLPENPRFPLPRSSRTRSHNSLAGVFVVSDMPSTGLRHEPAEFIVNIPAAVFVLDKPAPIVVSAGGQCALVVLPPIIRVDEIPERATDARPESIRTARRCGGIETCMAPCRRGRKVMGREAALASLLSRRKGSGTAIQSSTSLMRRGALGREELVADVLRSRRRNTVEPIDLVREFFFDVAAENLALHRPEDVAGEPGVGTARMRETDAAAVEFVG